MRDVALQNICQLVQRFLTTAETLQASVGFDTRAAISSRAEATLAPHKVLPQLQQQFQRIIAAIEDVHLDPQVEQRIRPFLTEGHRRLRLAGIEAMRLQAAKQPATVEKQRSLVQAHLDQLQKFAQAIADEVCPDPSGEAPRALP